MEGEEKNNNKKYQYANDTTLIVKDTENIDEAMGKIQKYCRGSGVNNKYKTVVMRIGAAKQLPGYLI